MKIKKITNLGLLALLGICLSCATTGQEQALLLDEQPIRMNQLGFYPGAPKVAVLTVETRSGETRANDFYVVSTDLQDTVFTGQLGEKRQSLFSSKTTRIADFSGLTNTGTYMLAVPGVGQSFPVEVKEQVHEAVAKAALKGFYFQQMSTDLPEAYAGKWARAVGHPDTLVQVHASAASASRPEGTIIAAPLGWYDAGDYNKYIVNSGITMGTLLSLYEDFPAYMEAFNLSIPENNNELPDLLDEVLWNLRWMLAMQDPADGGVYHKLTTANFEGKVMPDKAVNQRYVVQKSTAAALNFAAVMTQSARVYGRYPQQLPGLADSCLQAAVKAWNWARKNPDQLYDQPAMNKTYKPAINTGAYGDKDVSDEFVWAAAELWITTGEEAYRKEITELAGHDTMPLPSWNQVRSLGYYSLLRHEEELKNKDPQLFATLNQNLLTFADKLVKEVDNNAYATVMGASEKDFIWGSSAVAANQGIALIQAYRAGGNRQYIEHALSNLDYLLGRNATGYSFVTGYGHKTPMFPHHRPSEADGIEEPVPGLLAGGPNPGQQDGCDYPSKAADESYVDAECSYASNEIAINWNAPLVYLAAALEALHQQEGQVKF